jgi:hypothetical protein
MIGGWFHRPNGSKQWHSEGQSLPTRQAVSAPNVSAEMNAAIQKLVMVENARDRPIATKKM